MSDDFDPQGDYGEGGKNWDPPARGPHIFQLTECNVTNSKGGNKMLAIIARVVNQDDSSFNRYVRDWFVYKREFYWKLQKLCLAVNPEMKGAGKGGLNAKSQTSVNAHLLGRCFVAVVNHRQNSYYKESTGGEVTNIQARLSYYQALNDGEESLIMSQYGPDGPELPEEGGNGNGGGSSSGGGQGYSDDEIPF